MGTMGTPGLAPSRSPSEPLAPLALHQKRQTSCKAPLRAPARCTLARAQPRSFNGGLIVLELAYRCHTSDSNSAGSHPPIQPNGSTTLNPIIPMEEDTKAGSGNPMPGGRAPSRLHVVSDFLHWAQARRRAACARANERCCDLRGSGRKGRQRGIGADRRFDRLWPAGNRTMPVSRLQLGAGRQEEGRWSTR
jgi:hypothetical protein